MAGQGTALLYTASVFGQEDFPEVNEDALDAIGELLNCINGLYASAESQKGVNLELLPPDFRAGIAELDSREMLALPVYIKDECITFLIAIDDKIEMK
jgi:CheY-specific phosphatase CheX